MRYNPDNIFAKIIKGDIPSQPVFENDEVFAMNDISPAAPVHVLVLPKGGYASFDDFANLAGAEKVGRFFETVRKIAHDLGVAESGYRLIMNHGSHASQTVPHFHVHILGGCALGGLVQGDKLERYWLSRHCERSVAI